eukprot:Pgem_evm1s365
MKFTNTISIFTATAAALTRAQVNIQLNGGGACQLANVQNPNNPSLFQNGAMVQISTTRVCTCLNGEFLNCRMPAENDARIGVVVRPGLQVINNEEEEVNRPDSVARSLLQISQDFKPEDFVIDFRKVPVESMGIGGLVQAVNLANAPVLAVGAMAITRFTIDPCGINLPHVHPRGTELIFVFKGSLLRTVFAEENGGRIITNDITNDTTTFFPQGLMHYQQNMGCDTIAFASSLNSADPGVQTITTQFFKFPIEGVAGSLGIDTKQAEELRDGIPINIVLADKARGQCLQKCGLA